MSTGHVHAAEPGLPTPDGESISGARMILVMGTIGVLAAVLLVFTYFSTLPAIERNKAEALAKAIFEVVPGASQKTTFTPEDGVLRPLPAGEKALLRYHAAYDQAGALVGIAVEAQGQGFADVLKILYGYSPDCACVVGFKVLETKETPGLGDKIEKEKSFTSNFEALDVSLTGDGSTLENPVEFVKFGQKTQPWQVEGITGATVTSKAVATIMNASTLEVIPLLNANLEVLRDGSPSRVATAQD